MEDAENIEPTQKCVVERTLRARVTRTGPDSSQSTVYFVVYRGARDEWAVKVFHERRCFDDECAALDAVGPHPCIVRAVDRVDVAPIYALVMEPATRDLYTELSEHRHTLPVAEACAIAADVASALAHLHAHGLAYLDVKSENVLLFEDAIDGTLTAKLCDFALAVPADSDRLVLRHPLDRMNKFRGTHYTAAPEWYARSPIAYPLTVTTAADVWGLGILFLEMLVNDMKWTEWRMPELRARAVARVHRCTPPEARAVVEDVCTHMLVVDPAARDSAAQARERLLEHRLAVCDRDP